MPSSTSPDRRGLLRTPAIVVGMLVVIGLPLLWLTLVMLQLGGWVGWLSALVFGYLGASVAYVPFMQRRTQAAALARARDRGGLLHIVEVTRLSGGSPRTGWLTLHHETGDIGFFEWDTLTSNDVYIPRHTVATMTREPDDTTRITYLGDKIESLVIMCSDNDLALWHGTPEDAHAAADKVIPTATARIRDDE